jgi:hypothetical protein
LLDDIGLQIAEFTDELRIFLFVFRRLRLVGLKLCQIEAHPAILLFRHIEPPKNKKEVIPGDARL